MTYEEAMKSLEEIVSKLESENLPLEEAVALFEKASAMAKFAQDELSKATGKLYVIKKELDDAVEEEE